MDRKKKSRVRTIDLFINGDDDVERTFLYG